jgi:hypothetical protein
MNRKITTLSIIIISALLLQNCSTKKKAKGPEDEIHVIADSSEFLIVEDALDKTFGKIINTPQPEQLFQIKRQNLNNLKQLQLKKNLVILAPLNSGSYTSKYLESILDSNVTKLVLDDSVFVINRYDLWAQDQLVMILTAKDIESLESKIISQKDDLFYYFREKSNKRLAKGLYNSRFEQKDVEAKLLSNYGWLMYIQADYQLAMDKPEDNFVWLRRGVNTDMERWIFVHWIEDSSPEFLEVDSITSVRNMLTKKYYRTTDDSAYVELYDDFRMNSEVNFNGRYALMTQGLWRFNDQSMGGPFISYTFYDEETRRIYMLDASILAPKYLKKSLLQQVDVLLHSFKTESEVDPIRKEEILEELEQ